MNFEVTLKDLAEHVFIHERLVHRIGRSLALLALSSPARAQAIDWIGICLSIGIPVLTVKLRARCSNGLSDSIAGVQDGKIVAIGEHAAAALAGNLLDDT